MLDPSFPLQTAIFAALTAPGALPAVVGGRVYDERVQNSAMPYLSMGDCQVLPDKAECIDGAECFPIIDVWSVYKGYKEAKEIAAAILAKLDDKPQNLTVAGFNVIVFELSNYQPLRDPDGITRRVSITFRTLINPV
ncbi:DUF3168 domain-containing protein [Bradyrhizobium prioriisuperbiae]|uniref:DUF3168 domain-containing protein n=1 Tax=Bradyrhizobium prioriisuperbiae TaxID=2854389 RepID=UPI0028E6DDF7|nr:DUF3168 domain-containing protein [Bradyrhizobium prioritasuperba]